MADAKLRRTDPIRHRIQPDTQPSCPRHKVADTYKSQIFSREIVPEKVPCKRRFVPKDSAVLDGAKLQAAALKQNQIVRAEANKLPVAGKPVQAKMERNRTNKTYTSTVFDAPKQPERRYNVNKPLDTRDIIGSDESDFYRKAVNDLIPVVDFSPAYKETSPFKRRNDEFYNGYSGTALQRTKSTEKLSESLSAKERYARNLSSSAFCSPERIIRYSSPVKAEKSEKSDWANQTPHELKKKLMRSSVFDIETPDFKEIPQLESLTTLELMTGPRIQRPKSEIRGRRTLSSGSFEQDNLTAKQRKQEHLRSSLDLTYLPESKTVDESYVSRSFAITPDCDPKTIKLREMQSGLHTPDFYTKTTETDIQDLVLQGIDEVQLKEACKGVQVLKLEETVDPLTGQFKGYARLKIKGAKSKLNDIVLTLAEKGVNSAPAKPILGKSK